MYLYQNMKKYLTVLLIAVSTISCARTSTLDVHMSIPEYIHQEAVYDFVDRLNYFHEARGSLQRASINDVTEKISLDKIIDYPIFTVPIYVFQYRGIQPSIFSSILEVDDRVIRMNPNMQAKEIVNEYYLSEISLITDFDMLITDQMCNEIIVGMIYVRDPSQSISVLTNISEIPSDNRKGFPRNIHSVIRKPRLQIEDGVSSCVGYIWNELRASLYELTLHLHVDERQISYIIEHLGMYGEPRIKL